jgi:hypothetical protein
MYPGDARWTGIGGSILVIEYNLFDPLQVDNHEEVLAELRQKQPVAEVLPGIYYLSRYDDIVEL